MTMELAGRWRVVSMLGVGGMGSVYLAEDAKLGELVALKMVRRELALDPGMIERFREEVRLSRAVSSPYVARTHDLGEEDGRVFLTMQYVEGEPLSAKLKREGALPLADVVRIAHDVCGGLDAVHAAGIVHRDLKPGNVLLAKDGRAVLTDFGIALRRSGASHSDGSGTPSYTAPEQLLGGAVDARTDIYALGALLFAAATGEKPFVSPRTGNEPPPDPRTKLASVPEAFASVVMRALSVDPSRRYASAQSMYDALAPLASFGSRADSRLFDFVRSISRTAREVVIDLACDGVTEPIRAAVAHHIASRLGESGEVRATTNRAEAEAIVSGKISMKDGACKIHVELHSRDGDVFWHETIEGPAASLPALADAVATAAARALSAEARPTDDSSKFTSQESAELFLRARVEYRQFYLSNVDKAVELFDRIEKLEPNNPTVLAWKASALTRQRFFGDGSDRARELIERALALGSKEAIPYVALGEACLQEMRADETARAFVTALRLAPGMIDVRATFASFLSEVGAFEPALRLAESVRAAEPGHVAMLEVPMRLAALRGRFDESTAILAGVPRDAMGIVRLQLAGMRNAVWARDEARFREVSAGIRLEQIDPTSRRFFDAIHAAVLEGKPPQRAMDAIVSKMTARRRTLLFQFGCELSALLRDDANFFESLDRAVASGIFDAPWLDACPLFDPYRGSLHFETARRAVLRRAYDALVEIDRCLGEPS
jgi:serine/threonine-protein kinase